MECQSQFSGKKNKKIKKIRKIFQNIIYEFLPSMLSVKKVE